MLKKILTLLFLISLCVVWAIFSTYGSTSFLRKSYVIEAWWANKNIQCSQESEALNTILSHIIQHYGSLSNQVVYLKKNGNIVSCNSGTNVNENTRFRYASLTKVITAALFLEKEKLGLLNRQDYLQQYIEMDHSADARMQKIQLFNLLTHTSGFDRTQSRDPIIDEGNSWCPSHLEKLSNIRLDHAPNTKYSYDNRNYCILGAVLEKKIGQPFNVILNNYLTIHHFNHIKLIDGPFMQDEVNYDFRFEEYYFPSYTQKYNFYAMQSAAGLSGSAKDYAKLINYLMQRRQLPLTETVLETKDTDKNKVYASIALRQKITHSGEKVSYHFGALPASRSLVLIRSNGDVVAWMGSGVPQNPKINETQLLAYILAHLN